MERSRRITNLRPAQCDRTSPRSGGRQAVPQCWFDNYFGFEVSGGMFLEICRCVARPVRCWIRTMAQSSKI